MKLSVIVPTVKRKMLLIQCLQRLSDQLETDDEIIVISNDSNVNDRNEIRQYCRENGYTFLFEKRKGSSYARNRGLIKATGDILAFIDDDSLIDRKWIKNIKQIVLKDKNRGIMCAYMGKVKHRFSKVNLLTRIFHSINKNSWENIKKQKDWEEGYMQFLHTCNSFMHKDVLKNFSQVFDEKLFPFIGEERDFSVRLQLKGFQIQYAPTVSIVHDKMNPSLQRFLYNAFMYGRTQGVLCEKYGSDRMGVFADEISRLYPFQRRIEKIAKTMHFIAPVNIVEKIFALSYLLVHELLDVLGITYGKLQYQYFRKK